MVFTSPSVLWALSLIAIPIAIHLFQFRRYKQLYFSDVSLLKEVKTTSQTKNQLKHLLILLSRCLLIALLVMAFADPMIPAKDDAGSSDLVSIYVDNSFSMQSSTGSGSLLQHASQSAFDIASSYPPSTRFQLITNAFSANEKRFIDQTTLIERLDQIETIPIQRTLSEVLSFQKQSLQGEKLQRSTFLISDFSRFVDSARYGQDSLNSISVVVMENTEPQNISVDSAWLQTPISQRNVEQTLHFSISNHTPDPVANLPIEVEVDGQVVARPVLALEPNQQRDTAITFIPGRSGFLLGSIRLEDYPVSFDNAYHFVVEVSKTIGVVEVSGEELTHPSPFAALFYGDQFGFTSFSERDIKQATFENASLIILNEISTMTTGLEALCQERLAAGSNVVLVVPESINTELAESLRTGFGIRFERLDTLSLEVNQVNTDHYLYRSVFESPLLQAGLPIARKHYPLSSESFDESILTLYNRSPLLAAKRAGRGSVFVITAPLRKEFTNLHRHALFVPAMINMAAYAGVGKPVAYTIGTSTIRTIHRTEEASLGPVNDSTSFIPGMTYEGIVLGDQLLQPGHYHYRSEDSLLDAFAFNYARDESSLDPLSPEELNAMLTDRGIDVRMFDSANDDLSQDVVEANVGTDLWPIFVLCALCMLLMETILLKRSTS